MIGDTHAHSADCAHLLATMSLLTTLSPRGGQWHYSCGASGVLVELGQLTRENALFCVTGIEALR